MKAANGFLAALLLSSTTAHAGESPIQPRLRMAQAFGPDYQGYGGGYGGFGPITRMEVDSKASRRLLARMQSLGYMRWLLLVGVFRPEKGDRRSKVEVVLDYQGGRSTRLPPNDNRDAYFAKIALMASELFDVGVDDVLVTLKDVRCQEPFQAGRFVGRAGCGGGAEPTFGPPIVGLANDIRGTIPEGSGIRDVAARLERQLADMGAAVRSTVTEGSALVRADGLERAVMGDGDGTETVVLYVVRKTGGTGGEGGGPGPARSKGRYAPGYYIVVDGGRAKEKGGAFVPFEPAGFVQLDAFARKLNGRLSEPDAGRGRGPLDDLAPRR